MPFQLVLFLFFFLKKKRRALRLNGSSIITNTQCVGFSFFILLILSAENIDGSMSVDLLYRFFFVLFLLFVHECVYIEYTSVWSERERERSWHKSVRVINGPLGTTNSLFHFHWDGRWRGGGLCEGANDDERD